MSETDNQPDELQGLWQGTTGQSQKEDHSMILRLVRERQKSLLDLLRQQNASTYLFSLSFAPLGAICAWKSRPLPWMACGYQGIARRDESGMISSRNGTRRRSGSRGRKTDYHRSSGPKTRDKNIRTGT